MTIHVRLLGFFQMMLGTMTMEVSLDEPATLEDLWQYFQNTFAQFQKEDLRRIAGASVNGNYVPSTEWAGTPLNTGDKVDLLTQMGGG